MTKTITRNTDKTKRRMWREAHFESMHNCHPIVRRLAFLLYSQDQSIVDIFREAEVAPCMLHHWVSGRSNPQIRTLSKILDILGLELTIQRKKPVDK